MFAWSLLNFSLDDSFHETIYDIMIYLTYVSTPNEISSTSVRTREGPHCWNPALPSDREISAGGSNQRLPSTLCESTLGGAHWSLSGNIDLLRLVRSFREASAPSSTFV
ncbi:hypothetical protein FA13DRAFT_1309829 [Coprinellus micaceus]|uniref:Uncharacterized protein n=1 Tax=Coprinellus micaceus TaxID=71717 RepID=A0A4Y7R603_COPMI|nr:hypothetical protein FA13DRAFT_1309829 [Coprinellus micaceus]